MQLNKENLFVILEELITIASGEEEQLRHFIEHLSSDVRPLLIEIRDQALEQAAFDWAVLLSHFIYAMTEPTFWEEKTISPSYL